MQFHSAFVVASVVLITTAVRGEDGIASRYSTKDSDQTGTRVACPGYRLVDSSFTAAHRSLPCGTKVTVTNKRNGKHVTVTIIDRGPWTRGRLIDLSSAAASAIGMDGLAPVNIGK